MSVNVVGGSLDSVQPRTGPYVLCSLLDQVPLSPGVNDKSVCITCVEFWDGNLYIGTSAGEVLHYVLIPQDPSTPSEPPVFLPGQRLNLNPEDLLSNTEFSSYAGVQQILILPDTLKACVLCNGTLTFWSLPELGPAFGGSRKIPDCTWVGGVDVNPEEIELTGHDGVLVMVCLQKSIRLVSIGEKPKPIRTIGLGNCLATVRRGGIACAADNTSYSLLDVVEQQQIPLFEISSLPPDVPAKNNEHEISEVTPPSFLSGEDIAATSENQTSLDTNGAGNESAADREEPSELTDSTVALVNHHPEQDGLPERTTSLSALDPSDSSTSEVAKTAEVQAFVPKESNMKSADPDSRTKENRRSRLPPHIASPTPFEFLLTTGTTLEDPGIGLFVNLDGDVVRGTIEFSRYPLCIAVDGQGIDLATSTSPDDRGEAGYVLAIVHTNANDRATWSVEVQRWDLDPGEVNKKHFIHLDRTFSKKFEGNTDNEHKSQGIGLRSARSGNGVSVSDIVHKLQLRKIRFDHKDHDTDDEGRNRAETDFVSRLSSINSCMILWAADCLWWVVRNPILIRLDEKLQQAFVKSAKHEQGFCNRQKVEEVLNEMRGEEPVTELEFLSFKYLRQKASLLLLVDLVKQLKAGTVTHDRDRRITEEALVDGDIEPRAMLAVLPVLRQEIVHEADGIWLANGLNVLINHFLQDHNAETSVEPDSSSMAKIFGLAKAYLYRWRRKKGFGSISDEKEVFKSVDAALLRLLLILDSRSTPGRGAKGSIRAELNELVDTGVDCPDHAIELLERYKRLYVLSRLYQGQRMPSLVLSTFRRIVEGEEDLGGELQDGEEQIRLYLSKRKDEALVEQYGTWLALRNPKLGIRVFTDDQSEIRFKPEVAVSILKEKAPNAVKDFLEHLVFGKHLSKYANDLIGYYLDSVIGELETSDAARKAIGESYDAYRALQPPKPTYSHFAAENGIDEEWWRNRLRLLQLLGGSHSAVSSYDTVGMLTRIDPYSTELVPEMIILGGRQGRHKEAIHLLVHSLGDFDTAVSYCVLGGSSTYSTIGGPRSDHTLPSQTEQAELFGHLLEEFFAIQDMHQRITQTSELLERFAGWFDVEHVLSLVPDNWSVDLLSQFLQSSLRHLVSERHDSAIAKALNSKVNLDANATLLEKVDSIGASITIAE